MCIYYCHPNIASGQFRFGLKLRSYFSVHNNADRHIIRYCYLRTGCNKKVMNDNDKIIMHVSAWWMFAKNQRNKTAHKNRASDVSDNCTLYKFEYERTLILKQWCFMSVINIRTRFSLNKSYNRTFIHSYIKIIVYYFYLR